MEKWRRQNDNCQKIGFKWLSAFVAERIWSAYYSCSKRIKSCISFSFFRRLNFRPKFLCSTAAGAWCVSFSDMRSLFLCLFWCFYCKSCHIMFQNFQILRNLTMQVYCNPQLNLRIYNSDGHALGCLCWHFTFFMLAAQFIFGTTSHMWNSKEREKKTYWRNLTKSIKVNEFTWFMQK